MNYKIMLLALFIASALALRADTSNLVQLVQKGQSDEQVNHDLKAALADYQLVAGEYHHQRETAATATYRLGECYRLLGETNKAATFYEHLIKEFPDQNDLVTLSEQNLKGLGRPTTAIESSAAPSAAASLDAARTVPPSQSATNDPQDREIQRLQEIVQDNPDLINSPWKNPPPSEDAPQHALVVFTPLEQVEEHHGPNWRNRPFEGMTPLENAVAHDWVRAAAYLLDNGANVNRLDNKHSTPLVQAVQAGNRAMAELLLSRGAKPNLEACPDNPLVIAVVNNFTSIVELLLAHQADVNAPDHRNNLQNNPLLLACENGGPELVQMLLHAGANPNAQDQAGSTPLALAAQHGHAPEIKLLLAAGAKPNTGDNSGRMPLSWATTSGSGEAVQLLLAAQADPNGGSLDAPLQGAIHQMDVASAELLLRAGANPKVPGMVDDFAGGAGAKQNQTPILQAVDSGLAPMVQLLLKYHADPNDQSTEKQPLIFKALSDTNLLEALLAGGAQVDARDITGAHLNRKIPNWTPLMTAARGLAKDKTFPAGAVEVLLRHGANPNLADDSFGNTPLQWTPGPDGYRIPDRQVIDSLLDANADINHRNFAGQTLLDELKRPLNVAADTRTEMDSLAEYLQTRGALDRLPDMNKITVRRSPVRYSQVVLTQQANDWNQFTLTELIAIQYHFLTRHPSEYLPDSEAIDAITFWRHTDLFFPDFARIGIHRLNANRTQFIDQTVDLSPAIISGNPSPEVFLQWGDTVEIPKASHPDSEPWQGIPFAEVENLDHCLTRQVDLMVQGQTRHLTLALGIHDPPDPANPGQGPRFFHTASFWLGTVIFKAKLAAGSVDLAHVKVTRRKSDSGKAREYSVDCSHGFQNQDQESDLWLRDGDVIVIPGKS